MMNGFTTNTVSIFGNHHQLFNKLNLGTDTGVMPIFNNDVFFFERENYYLNLFPPYF